MADMKVAGRKGGKGPEAEQRTFARCPKCNTRYIKERHDGCPECSNKKAAKKGD